MNRIIAIADDLSGAAETAAALVKLSAQNTQGFNPLLAGTARIFLVPEDPLSIDFEDSPHSILVLDSNSRKHGPQDSYGRLDAILRRIDEAAPLVFLKIDSLLRGHLAGQLGVMLRRGPVIFAPALPQLSRTTVGGVVMVEGVPLHESPLWSAEERSAPSSITEALDPLTTNLIPLSVIRGNSVELDRVFGHLPDNTVSICDAETTEDLDVIATTALRHHGIQQAGASGLATALRRALEARQDRPGPRARQATPRASRAETVPESVAIDQVGQKPVLIVVGTASTQSQAQLELLTEIGVTVLRFTPAELLSGNADPSVIRASLMTGSTAVSISSPALDPTASQALASSLAQLVRPIANLHPLVLTGGETARTVLDTLGVRWIEPLAEIEFGAILSRTDRDSLVATRPGAFGGPGSLHNVVTYLQSFLASEVLQGN